MRLYDLSPTDIERVLGGPAERGFDKDGNPLYVGPRNLGQSLPVVVALDDPNLVITIWR